MVKSMNLYIVIKTSFDAIHAWPDCPFFEVEYLKSVHRHVFHVTLKWEVFHNNRDKEFIIMKQQVESFIYKNWKGKNLGTKSCEQLAVELLKRFDAVYVSVFEDNENGAEAIDERQKR